MGQSRIAGGIIGQVLADGIRGYFATTGAHINGSHRVDGGSPFTVPVSLTALLQRVPDWWVAVRERLVGLVPEWPAKQEEPTIQPSGSTEGIAAGT